MEKEKRKNNQLPFFKTPRGFSYIFMAILVVTIIVIVPIIVAIGFVILVFSTYPRNEQFVEINTPLVQDAIRYQCQMSDYVADGSWNDSIYPLPYYDIIEDGVSRIDCELENNRWQCTCRERD